MADNQISTIMKTGEMFVVHGEEGKVKLEMATAEGNDIPDVILDIEDAKDLVFALNKGLYDAGYRGEVIRPATAKKEQEEERRYYPWTMNAKKRRGV